MLGMVVFFFDEGNGDVFRKQKSQIEIARSGYKSTSPLIHH